MDSGQVMDAFNLSDFNVSVDYTLPVYSGDFLPPPSEEDFLPKPLPNDMKTAVAILYSLIMLFALSGNTLVIFVILGNKALRNVTNIFLLSLAFSDILIAGWNIPLSLLYHFNVEWTFGETLCKTISFTNSVNVVASITTLTAVALERYYAICHPLKIRYVKTTKRAAVVLVIIWIIAVALSLPFLWVQRESGKLAHTDTFPFIRIAKVCVEYFEKPEYNTVLTYVQFILYYCAPMLVMFFAYGNIAHQLWVRKPIGDSQGSPQNLEKSGQQKRRIIKMLIVVVTLFGICWLPFFVFHVYNLYHPLHVYDDRFVMVIIQLVGFSNCAMNPIIYGVMNQKFKQSLKMMYTKCRKTLYVGKPPPTNRQTSSAPNSITVESAV